MTLSGMLRDIENFRSKDQKVVIEDYKNKLKLAEEQRKIAQAKLDQHLNEVANQENQYNINTVLVRNTIKDIDDPKVKSGLSYLDIAKQLIDAGCDINAQNNLLLNYAKDKFKKAANIEPETTNLTELKILDFVYQTQAVLTAKRLLPVKQNIAANSIQYLWNSYKISQEELGARGSLIKQLNKSKHHIEQLPAHKIFVSAFEKIKKAQ